MRLDVCEFANIEKVADEEGFESEVISFTEIDCEIRSVSRSEHYMAKSASLKLALICVVDTDDFNYYGKPTKIRYQGELYRVERAYKNPKTYETELTLVEVE